MTNFIPIFPLNIVVFPTELLNLHIFEPRYIQLINDCIRAKKTFGICTVINNKIQEYGTVVEIVTVEKTYDTGEMDIKTKAIHLFNTIEIIDEIPDKLYKGAIVVHNQYIQEYNNNSVLSSLIHEFHALIYVEKKYKKSDEELTSFDVAHHVGLTLEQEYEILCLPKEKLRQQYLIAHLKKTIPTIQELHTIRKRILLNGHFQKLSVNNE